MDIRNIIDMIAENSKNSKKNFPFSANTEIMSLQQFIDDQEEKDDILSSKSSEGIEEEVDEAKLSGVTARKFDTDELKDYIKRIVGTTTGEKTKRGTEKYVSGKTKQDKYKKPYIHRSNVVPIKNEKDETYDLDKLKNMITMRPTKLLKQNEKMQHSDGSASIFFNIGVPALKGLAFDESNNEFVIIDTCPGAGMCQTYCFAMKGGYVQWKSSSLEATKRLNWLYNDPDGFMDQLNAEITKAEKKYNKKNTKVVIRWHDAGDFLSLDYLDKAYALAKKHPNTDFYAYTKISSVAQSARPDNFKMNFSMGAKPSQEKQIDFGETKNSRVVPEVLFKDIIDRVEDKSKKPNSKGVYPTKLEYKDHNSINTLKARLAAKYSVDINSILTYDEMMKTPQSEEPNKYNVIVKPGDGDDSANRKDVLNTFLLMH